MKKILIPILLILLLLIAGFTGFKFYKNAQPDFSLTTDAAVAELGAEVNLKDYIVPIKNVAIDDITITTDYKDQVGTYTVTYTIKKLEKSLTLEVKDTTPPTLVAIDLTTTKGTVIDPLTGVKAEDLSPVTCTLIGEGPNYNKVGTYPVSVMATDVYGNSTTASFNIIVVKKAASPAKDPVIYLPEGCGNSAAFDAAGIEAQPYLVTVNRKYNTVTVYEKDTNGNYTVPIKAMACSVGREGHETITGRYNTLERFDWCYMVDSSYGRYAIRIKGGYMFHTVCYFTMSKDDLEYEEYNKLGEPASLGCIRLNVADEKWLYDNCPFGFPTVIYDDETSPGPLGKPETIKIDVNDEEHRGWDPTDPERPF